VQIGSYGETLLLLEWGGKVHPEDSDENRKGKLNAFSIHTTLKMVLEL
jgi:hypothetical protein